MTIRSRLLLLALLATLLPAALELSRFLDMRRETIRQDTARLAQMADQQARTISERIQGTAQLLYGLARTDSLTRSDNREACSRFLNEVRETYPQYTGILTIKPDGQLFCDSLRTGRQLDLRDRAYFKAAQAAPVGLILEPAFGRLTGIAVLQVVYPVVTSEGELSYLLLASLNLPQLLETENLAVRGARFLLVDHKGTVLASSRSDGSGDLSGSSITGTALFKFISGRGAKTAEVKDAAGNTEVWAVADSGPIDKAKIHVAVGVRKSLLVTAADQRFQQDLALLASSAVLLFLAVWLMAEFGIRRQIDRLTRMARQLAGGDLSARIAPPLPGGELGTLMLTLNQTAESLEQQRIDIAELNAKLQQSQRMEAIGQLTGGVAHDFNNLLTVVLGNAELLAELQIDNPQQRQLAESIVNAAQRGADLTRGLLAFARKQALDPKSVDINALLASIDPMLRRTLGEHIEIELIRAAGLWPALVDPGQLENALLNLCLNARDAMPGGGHLVLETANIRLDTDYAQHHADVTPGPYVMVAISDSGEGIAPENLRRVFEPFYTTKEKGKGTGLGMAMVYGFVKQSAGHIAIYSEVGQGTSVKLYLPRVRHEKRQPAEPDARVCVAGGSETILLVEDDDAVRSYAKAALLSFGYSVIEAADGTAALELIRQNDRIDLLFTDVVMPGGMNGRVLADAAREIRPALRVLYTSGYTEDAIVHHGRLDADAQLLSKPYRRSDLDRAVRAALMAGTE